MTALLSLADTYTDGRVKKRHTDRPLSPPLYTPNHLAEDSSASGLDLPDSATVSSPKPQELFPNTALNPYPKQFGITGL